MAEHPDDKKLSGPAMAFLLAAVLASVPALLALRAAIVWGIAGWFTSLDVSFGTAFWIALAVGLIGPVRHDEPETSMTTKAKRAWIGVLALVLVFAALAVGHVVSEAL